MFDAALCGIMPLADIPAVGLDALQELRALLALVRGGATPLLQAGHPDPLSSGVAHASLAQSSAPRQAVAIVPAVAARTELGVVASGDPQQIEQLLARMLRDHAARSLGTAPVGDDHE